MDEIQKLRKSVGVAVRRLDSLEGRVTEVEKVSRELLAKVSFLKDGVGEVKEAMIDVSADLEAFLDFYADEHRKVNERLSRLEEHTGL